MVNFGIMLYCYTDYCWCCCQPFHDSRVKKFTANPYRGERKVRFQLAASERKKQPTNLHTLKTTNKATSSNEFKYINLIKIMGIIK